MQFCRYCGGRTPDDSVFCASCGQRLQAPPQEATHASDAPTLSSQPLPNVPAHSINEDEEKEEQNILPPVAPAEAPATGNVPTVQGTPQVGTVPSIPAGAAPVAATFAAGTVAKVILVAATCATVILGGMKAAPILFHKGPAAAPTSVPAPVTVPMPPTQTSCPANGQARAAVMRTLVLGTHQNIVYVENTSSFNAPPTSADTLRRYDTTTGKITQIVKGNNAISEAHVSPDGQWVLFISSGQGSNQSVTELQMIRMDGQGLQTLYCTTTEDISHISWSPDEKTVAFAQTQGGNSQSKLDAVYMLNMTNGVVQQELVAQTASISGGTWPSYWLDPSRVYILTTPPNTADTPPNLYILNTKNGANQTLDKLAPVLVASGGGLPTLGSYSISPDGKQLFISTCSCGHGPTSGPSSITVQPATGGPQRTIFTTQTLAITAIRAISNTSLLLFSEGNLYKVQTDGTGFTKLTSQLAYSGSSGTFVPSNSSVLDQDWASISRDSSMYALIVSSCIPHCQLFLLFGSLKGSTSTQLAQNLYDLKIAGWTAM